MRGSLSNEPQEYFKRAIIIPIRLTPKRPRDGRRPSRWVVTSSVAVDAFIVSLYNLIVVRLLILRYLCIQEAEIPRTNFDHEIAEGLRLGLPGASSIVDKSIPTFSRGELPHFAGINTFLKAPYLEDASQVGKYDVAVVGVPFDGGCTYRAGTRFGPQGIRRISALYTPYNYEKGIDLREQMVCSLLLMIMLLIC
jgi:Arginase family